MKGAYACKVNFEILCHLNEVVMFLEKKIQRIKSDSHQKKKNENS